VPSRVLPRLQLRQHRQSGGGPRRREAVRNRERPEGEHGEGVPQSISTHAFHVQWGRGRGPSFIRADSEKEGR